jgi:translation elongation factor EF-1alpha
METRVGHVTHFFDHISVAALELEESLSAGDEIHILGYNTDIVQHVESIEINHHRIQQAGPGAEVGIKVEDRVHKGDVVFKVVKPVPELVGLGAS